MPQQKPRGRLGVVRPRERGGDGRDGLELAVADRRLGLRLARPHAARDEGALAPAADQEERRHEGHERRHEGRPELAAERLAIVEHEEAEDRRRHGDAGEERPEPEVDRGQPAPVTP